MDFVSRLRNLLPSATIEALRAERVTLARTHSGGPYRDTFQKVADATLGRQTTGLKWYQRIFNALPGSQKIGKLFDKIDNFGPLKHLPGWAKWFNVVLPLVTGTIGAGMAMVSTTKDEFAKGNYVGGVFSGLWEGAKSFVKSVASSAITLWSSIAIPLVLGLNPFGLAAFGVTIGLSLLGFDSLLQKPLEWLLPSRKKEGSEESVAPDTAIPGQMAVPSATAIVDNIFKNAPPGMFSGTAPSSTFKF